MSFVKGFSTRFAGFLKSPGQGLHPRPELGRWGRRSLPATLLLTGGSVRGCRECARGPTFSAHQDLPSQARSHQSCGQMDGQHNQSSWPRWEEARGSGCPLLSLGRFLFCTEELPLRRCPRGFRGLRRGESP